VREKAPSHEQFQVELAFRPAPGPAPQNSRRLQPAALMVRLPTHSKSRECLGTEKAPSHERLRVEPAFRPASGLAPQNSRRLQPAALMVRLPTYSKTGDEWGTRHEE